MGDDAQLQEDEIIALESIYPEAARRVPSDDDGAAASRGIDLAIPSFDAPPPRIDVRVRFPPDWKYPSEAPPLVEVDSDVAAVDGLVARLEDMCAQSRGEPVLVEWLGWLLEQWEEIKPPVLSSVPETKTTNENEETTHAEENQDLSKLSSLNVVHGEPITERKSTFQAHCCPVKSVDDVAAFLDALLVVPKVRSATHNIMAYRFELERGGMAQDCDDDGESAAGGRLLHLLQIADARNVAVVVSRWFGGIHLGPARFGLINKAAKELLVAQGYVKK